MPPRWLRGLIVAGWLAAAGWFVSRDIWPSFRRDDAPPYFVNLAEETTLTQGSSHVTRWSIYRGRVEIGKEIGKAKTWIDYLPGPDAFDLHSELTLQRPDGRGLFRAVLALPRLVGDLFVLAVATEPANAAASGDTAATWALRWGERKVAEFVASLPRPRRTGEVEAEAALVSVQMPQLFGPGPIEFAVLVPKLINTHRISRSGDLLATTASGSLRFRLRGPGAPDLSVPIDFQIEAEARPEGLLRRGEVTLDRKTVKVQLKPVPLRPGTVYRPGSLLNRIEGLHVGQRWRLPPDDPLDEVIQEALPQVLEQFGLQGARELTALLKDRLPPEREVEAEVQEAPEPFTWNNVDYPCLQIVYTREGQPFATTWVRQSDGLMLRQEWVSPGGNLIFQRD